MLNSLSRIPKGGIGMQLLIMMPTGYSVGGIDVRCWWGICFRLIVVNPKDKRHAPLRANMLYFQNSFVRSTLYALEWTR
jgi:hypothetical protein